MVKDDSTGEYKEQKIKPLTERQLKKIELEKKNTELEIEIGKKLARTKKGKVDNRSVKERTPAQIAHSKKLVELNRLRREKKTAEKKDSLDKSIDESVKKSIVQVITAPKEMIKEVKPEWKPPPPPKKTDRKIRPLVSAPTRSISLKYAFAHAFWSIFAATCELKSQ